MIGIEKFRTVKDPDADILLQALFDFIKRITTGESETIVIYVKNMLASGNIDIGGEHTFTAYVLISNAPQGVAPLQVSSTTLVDNLNADKWDSKEYDEHLQFLEVIG